MAAATIGLAAIVPVSTVPEPPLVFIRWATGVCAVVGFWTLFSTTTYCVPPAILPLDLYILICPLVSFLLLIDIPVAGVIEPSVAELTV